MLSRKEFLEWSLRDPKDRKYKSDAEKRFVETVENPPAPNKKLIELFRETNRYSKSDS